MLKEYYKFKVILNDFFKQKPILPKQPQDIKIRTEYMYPITDDNIAKEFLTAASSKYKITFPISPEIMTANPTDKPRLPSNSDEIQDFNLTIPISSTRQLIDTARMLRSHYYFNKIPDTWIEINQNTEENPQTILAPDQATKPYIPDTLVQLQESLEKIKEEIYITLPIENQEDIPPTLTTLRQYFEIAKKQESSMGTAIAISRPLQPYIHNIQTEPGTAILIDFFFPQNQRLRIISVYLPSNNTSLNLQT